MFYASVCVCEMFVILPSFVFLTWDQQIWGIVPLMPIKIWKINLKKKELNVFVNCWISFCESNDLECTVCWDDLWCTWSNRFSCLCVGDVNVCERHVLVVFCSGPNDHVFVYFTDHGAPGILAFPDDDVSTSSSCIVSHVMFPVSPVMWCLQLPFDILIVYPAWAIGEPIKTFDPSLKVQVYRLQPRST